MQGTIALLGATTLTNAIFASPPNQRFKPTAMPPGSRSVGVRAPWHDRGLT